MIFKTCLTAQTNQRIPIHRYKHKTEQVFPVHLRLPVEKQAALDSLAVGHHGPVRVFGPAFRL